jgi:hypothetical protein
MATLTGINKVNWGQVGRVTRPDRYQYSFGWLTIAADDIAIWEKNPNAGIHARERRSHEGSPGGRISPGHV